jgi:hypothetical protein
MTGLSSFLVQYGMEIYRTLYVSKVRHTWNIYAFYTTTNTGSETFSIYSKDEENLEDGVQLF